jgi:hypothetical protein
MSVVSTDSPQEIARRDALAQRLFTGLLETMELLIRAGTPWASARKTSRWSIPALGPQVSP